MKTERMVLLVTPEEKARIVSESGRLGVSGSEYLRRLVALLDADDLAAMEEFAQIVPELGAAADRLEKTFAEFNQRQALHEERMAYQASPEYREKVRQDLLNDPTINWDHVRRLFGGEPDQEEAAAE